MIIEKMNYLMPSVIEADLSALLWQPNTFPGSDTFNQLIVTGFIVFWIGLTGIFFNRRLVISILLAVELTLLSINLLMLTFAAAMEDLVGVMFALYILCVAAAESAIGLALIIIWYRVRRTVSVQYISLLKG
uniref:NADH dehydrogenase subunit 4L n=1 Tax=Ulva intestinalis TaxID=3116 RepID=A0A8K1M9X8_ULVIN|nr:NADH dehydrogenase subunit 4L [Ulva intestinalis]UBR43435.1 NADH dehydrogenase subunit 4L [Ulva intestinalis]